MHFIRNIYLFLLYSIIATLETEHCLYCFQDHKNINAGKWKILNISLT